jgi:predicted DNA-binding transcriptional regulator AlpA
MMSGKLPFSIRSTKDGRLMNHVVIPTTYLDLIGEMHFSPGEYPDFAFEPRINGRDAEEMLNVGPTTFSRATKNAEVPTSTGGTYERIAIRHLAATTISASEIFERWNPGERRLPEPLKGADAPVRIGQLGWSRKEVERAMATRVCNCN